MDAQIQKVQALNNWENNNQLHPTKTQRTSAIMLTIYAGDTHCAAATLVKNVKEILM